MFSNDQRSEAINEIHGRNGGRPNTYTITNNGTTSKGGRPIDLPNGLQ